MCFAHVCFSQLWSHQVRNNLTTPLYISYSNLQTYYWWQDLSFHCHSPGKLTPNYWFLNTGLLKYIMWCRSVAYHKKDPHPFIKSGSFSKLPLFNLLWTLPPKPQKYATLGVTAPTWQPHMLVQSKYTIPNYIIYCYSQCTLLSILFILILGFNFWF